MSEFIFQSFVEADAIHVPSNSVADCPVCALSVEYHMQRFGYTRSRSYMLYLYVFDAGLNKHDILLRLLLSRKSHQIAHDDMIHANDDQLWLAHLLLYHDFNVDEKYEDNWLLYLSSPGT